jgi:hypothetical protein
MGTVAEESSSSKRIVQSHKEVLAITAVGDIESPDDVRAGEDPQADSRIHLKIPEVPSAESTHDSPEIEEGRDFEINEVIECLHLFDGNTFLKIEQQCSVIDEAALTESAKGRFPSQRGELVKWNVLCPSIHGVEKKAGDEDQLVIVVGTQVSGIEGGSYPRACSAVLEVLIQLNGEIHIGPSRRDELFVARVIASREFMSHNVCTLKTGELAILYLGLW